MDLWVRSQDKNTLGKYDKFTMAQLAPQSLARVMGLINNDYGWETLGKYSTNERALEVLDEIQRLLMEQNIMCFKNTGLEYKEHKALYQAIQYNQWVALQDDAKVEYISPSTIVYEMPLE